MKFRINIMPVMRAHLPVFVFVFGLFAIGTLFGFLLVSALSIEQQQQLSRYLGNFMQLAVQGQLSDLQLDFSDAWLAHLKWWLLTWLFGASVIGVPFILVLDFLKGALLGFTVGYLTAELSWRGLLFALVAVFPSNLILVPTLLMSSAAAITFALVLLKSRLRPQQSAPRKNFLRYSLIVFSMVPFLLLAALIEVYVIPHFIRWAVPLFV